MEMASGPCLHWMNYCLHLSDPPILANEEWPLGRG
jgi:hypothetical protein